MSNQSSAYWDEIQFVCKKALKEGRKAGGVSLFKTVSVIEYVLAFALKAHTDYMFCVGLENQQMPNEAEMNDICKKLFVAVQSLAPKTEYEEFYKIVEKRERVMKNVSGETFRMELHLKHLWKKNIRKHRKKKQLL